jgi:N6-L-threonylcarbamoyladenine synthase
LLSDLDAIAVTAGPGLVGALLVGLELAKSLAWMMGLPVIPVNHLEGHLLAALLLPEPPEPPFLGLVVSGGHTSLYEVKALGSYRRLATTRDDAAGEAYDKTARLLGLPYPGGRPIDELAQKGDSRAIRFPRALPAHDEWDWSFSGLKTAVRHHVERVGLPTGQALADLCASFQEAVADALTKKLIAAARALSIQNLVLCGGVAANSRLRALAIERSTERGLKLFLPTPQLCTDNGAMIAVAGMEAFRRGVQGSLNLTPQPAWRL